MVVALADDRVEQLTEAQREVLRLVAAGLGSKDIARQLKRSHHSIDRRIERAMHSMGVANRYVAARRVVEAEGRTYDPLARASSHLSQPTETATLPGPDDATDRPADRQAKAEVLAASSSLPASFPWPFPTRGYGRVMLDRKTRFAWALFGIPVLVMIAWGLLLAGIGALDTLRV
jgi:DNA-binding CsgD family transcriptional regulator